MSLFIDHSRHIEQPVCTLSSCWMEIRVKKNHSSSAKEWPSAEGKAVKLILNSTRHVQPLQTQELPVCIPQLTPVCRRWKFRSLFQAHHQGRLALFSLCSQLTTGEKNRQGSLREDHCPGPACELCPCICQPGVTGARTGSSDHPLWRPEVAVQQDEGAGPGPALSTRGSHIASPGVGALASWDLLVQTILQERQERGAPRCWAELAHSSPEAWVCLEDSPGSTEQLATFSGTSPTS